MENIITTAIIGYGWVGQAVHKLLPDSYIYDKNMDTDKGDGIDVSREQRRKEINEADIAFICVPTPYKTDANGVEGELDVSIVEDVVSWCKCPLIVIRSTINPGTCDMINAKHRGNIVFQPEYLGETPQHPLLDQKMSPFLIIGGDPVDRKKLIDLYTTVYNANIKIRQVSNLEAEVIKLTENRAIAFKRGEIQELYDVCEEAGIDYYTIINAVYGDDPRFTLWWTFQFPGNSGFNSKCIPKDVYAWCAWAESVGYEPKLTRGLLERNKKWI